MELKKESKLADGMADLYRSALFLGRGSVKVGLDFFSKAKRKLTPTFRLEKSLDEFSSLPENDARKNNLFWAEKVLDQYLKFKHSKN